MVRHIVLSLMLLLGVAATAQAQVRNAPERTAYGFRACNKSSGRIEVAKALNVKPNASAPDDIISEGWYKLNPGECVTLYPGRLEYRYYMVFAQEINGSRIWGGNIPICVSHERFRIRTQQCGSSYNRRMFKEVDTGDEREGWTHNFTN